MKQLLPLLLAGILALSAPNLFAQDYGNGFETQISGTDYGSVWMLDAMNIVAVGSYANIHKSYDGGKTWYMRANGIPWAAGTQDFNHLYFVNDSVGYAIMTITSSVAKTTDAGETWTMYSTFLTGSKEVYFKDANTGFIINSNTAKKSTDGGVTWNNSLTSAGNFIAITGTSTTLWICGGTGNLRKSTNTGATWQNVSLPTTVALKDIEFYNDSIGWIVGDGGTIYKTTNAGTNWTLLPQTLTGNFFELRVANEDTLFASLGNDSTYRSFDGGLSWQVTPVTSGQYITSIDVDVNTNKVIAVGRYGLVGNSDDFGSTFSQLNPINYGFFYSSSFADAQNGWFGSGKIVHTTDGGKTWNTQITGSWGIYGIHSTSPLMAWAVGTSGNGLRTIDGGANWITMTTNVTEDISSVFFINNTTGWFCTEGGKIFKSVNGGVTWTQQLSNAGYIFYSIHFVNATTGWVAGNGTLLMKTTNGGSTWVNSNTGISTSATRSIFFTDVNNGYAVGHTSTSSNTIYKTIDGGTSWAPYVNPAASHAKCVRFINSNVGYVSCEKGKLAKTIDAGLTWNLINVGYSQSLRTVSIYNEDTLWVGTDYGNILGFNNCSYPVLTDVAHTTPVCEGSTINLTADNVAGATYQWYGPNGLNATGNPYTIGSASLTDEGVYYVNASDNGCAGKYITDTIEIIPLPMATDILNADSLTACSGDVIVLNCNSQAGASYQWLYNGTPVGTNSVNYSATQSGNYTVQTYSFCGSINSPDTINLEINPSPNVSLSPLSPVCSNVTPFTLNIASLPGGTYTGNGIIAGTFDPSAAGVGTHTINYYYQDSGTGCDTTVSSSVTVLASPNTPVISGSDSIAICLGDSVQLSTNTQVGMNYLWYFNSTSTSETGNSLFANATGTYEVEVYNGCDTLLSNTVDLFVNTPPAVSLGSFSIVCENDVLFALTGGTPAGGTYSGTGVTGGMFEPATAGAGTHIISYTYIDPVTTCDSTATSSIVVDQCLGLNDFSIDKISIYPNPSSGIIFIREIKPNSILKIYNAQGELVFTGTTQDNSTQVDVTAFSSGLYFIEVKMGQKILREKIIIEKMR